jgi:hypothetical protein
MADSDYNAIKPVESLQTIQGVEPAKRRQERKRRQNAKDKHQEKTETERDDAAASETVHNDDDPHSIDYCA